MNWHLLTLIPLMAHSISARETLRDRPNYRIHGRDRSLLRKVRYTVHNTESTQWPPDGTLRNMFSLTIQNYHQTKPKYGQVCFQ